MDAYADDEAGTFFIATAERFLDPDTGRPIPELFRDDRLHLSQAGYAVWARVIAAARDEVLADAQAESVRGPGSDRQPGGWPGAARRSPR